MSKLEKVPDDLEPADKEEVYHIPEEKDKTTIDRKWCSIKECPMQDKCKPKSFSKSSCWSFVSHEVCMQYVMRHLVKSGHHLKTQKEAIQIMKEANMKWEYGVDTYKDRQSYRKELASWTKAQECKKSDDGGGGSGSCEQVATSSNKRPRTDSQAEGNQSIDKILNRALQSQLYLLLDKEDITSDIHKKQTLQISGVLELGKALSDVTVSAEQIKHLRDVLVRADSSLSNAKTRCIELSRTLHNEQVVVRDAIVALKRLVESDSVFQ